MKTKNIPYIFIALFSSLT